MGETLVRLEPAQELVVEKLTKAGVFKTRSEVIRAGILELGKEFNVFKNFQELEDELVVRKMIRIDKEIKHTYQLAQALQLIGTPAFFVGKTSLTSKTATPNQIVFIPGQVDQAQLEEIIKKISTS